MASTFLDRISGVETSIAIKAPVKVATTAPIALSGEQTIDGVAVVSGDRVLVKDQASAIDNGIWDVSTGVWARSDDFNGVRDATRGTSVLVTEGSKNGWARFSLATDAPSIGVSGLTFFADGASFAISPRNFGAVGNGVTDDTAAIRATFDRAISLLQSGYTDVEVDGLGQTFGLTDEALSDAFQSAWWSQTNLRKGKFLVFRNATLKVLPAWVSAVRNTTNGNERSYGPWANEPSPAALLPVMASNAASPASFSVSGVTLLGTDTPGKDPIPLLTMNELDARTQGLVVKLFSNWGEVIMGSYNSIRAGNTWEGIGVQPVESGAVLGGAAGFPTPRVVFDYNAATNTITAKAGSAFSTYSAGDTVPFFIAGHVGKRMVVHGGDAGGTQPLKVQVASIGGGGTTATVTLVSGSVTDQNRAAVAASFFPVRATTVAASAQVTLSAPVRIGRGAADMVGQLVAIPKAGSTANPELDMLCSRILSCDTGDDASGYTVLTLADAAREAVTEDFITSAAHSTLRDEASIAAGTVWNINDTDFSECRWENSGGYNDDTTAGGYQWVVQDAGESVQYVACKVHGANPIRSGFAAEGQCIVDVSGGLSLIGVDFTHMGMHGDGSVRFMGARQLARIIGCGVGGWQLPHDWTAFFLDPQSGYDPDLWSVIARDPMVKNDYFPRISQALWGRSASVTVAAMMELRRDARLVEAEHSTPLTSADDLNDIVTPGRYQWATSAPANSITFSNYSELEVTRAGTSVKQVVYDFDNKWFSDRSRFSGSWTEWRLRAIRTVTTADLSNAAHSINTSGKFQGALHQNSTNGKAYIANGSTPTSTWTPVDGTTAITPV